MSNIIIYLPNEPLGKQGGMEKATHQLACLLRDSGHNVSLLCQQKNRLGVPYHPPVPLIFIPQKLDKKEKRDFINDLIRQKQTELIIDQTEGGIIGKYGIFKNRKQIQSNKIKFVAVQHSSQYTYLKYYRFIKKKHFENSFSGQNSGRRSHFRLQPQSSRPQGGGRAVYQSPAEVFPGILAGRGTGKRPAQRYGGHARYLRLWRGLRSRPCRVEG